MKSSIATLGVLAVFCAVAKDISPFTCHAPERGAYDLSRDLSKRRVENTPDDIVAAGYTRSAWYNQRDTRDALIGELAESNLLGHCGEEIVPIFREDNLDGFKAFLAKRAQKGRDDFKDRPKTVVTYVRLAVLFESEEIFKFLLAESARTGVYSPSSDILPDNTLCYVLVRLNECGMLKHILEEYKVSPDQLTDRNRVNDEFGVSSPLTEAATCGYRESMIILLDAGADPNKPTSTFWRPLTATLRNDLIDIFKLLVERGADINLRTDNFGVTLLMNAVRHHAPKTLQYLIDNGADVNAVATGVKSKWTALNQMFVFTPAAPWNQDNDSTEVLDILYANGFKDDLDPDYSFHLLRSAARSHYPNALRYICKRGYLDKVPDSRRYDIWDELLSRGVDAKVMKTLWELGFPNYKTKPDPRKGGETEYKRDPSQFLKANLSHWLAVGRTNGYYLDDITFIPQGLLALAREHDPSAEIKFGDIYPYEGFTTYLPTAANWEKMQFLFDYCGLDLTMRTSESRSGTTLLEAVYRTMYARGGSEKLNEKELAVVQSITHFYLMNYGRHEFESAVLFAEKFDDIWKFATQAQMKTFMKPIDRQNRKTANLSRVMTTDPVAGLDLLLSVDEAIPSAVDKALKSRDGGLLVSAISSAKSSGKRIVLCAGGADGKVAARLVSAIHRHARESGDAALERSVSHLAAEGDEAAVTEVVRGLKLGRGDMIVGISADGRNASVNFAVKAGLAAGASGFFVSNAGSGIFHDMMRLIGVQNIGKMRPLIVEIATGEMAVVRAPHLQAATGEELFLGAAFEKAWFGRDPSETTASFAALLGALRAPENLAALAALSDSAADGASDFASARVKALNLQQGPLRLLETLAEKLVRDSLGVLSDCRAERIAGNWSVEVEGEDADLMAYAARVAADAAGTNPDRACIAAYLACEERKTWTEETRKAIPFIPFVIHELRCR